MKNTQVKKLLLLFIMFFLFLSVCEAQEYKRSIRNPERGLFGKSLNTRTVKYRESPSVRRAKKKQLANQKKLKKEYNAYVKKQRKHNIDIQSPEVKARMTENSKESDRKYKEKKKARKENTKKGGAKYN